MIAPASLKDLFAPRERRARGRGVARSALLLIALFAPISASASGGMPDLSFGTVEPGGSTTTDYRDYDPRIVFHPSNPRPEDVDQIATDLAIDSTGKINLSQTLRSTIAWPANKSFTQTPYPVQFDSRGVPLLLNNQVRFVGGKYIRAIATDVEGRPASQYAGRPQSPKQSLVLAGEQSYSSCGSPSCFDDPPFGVVVCRLRYAPRFSSNGDTQCFAQAPALTAQGPVSGAHTVAVDRQHRIVVAGKSCRRKDGGCDGFIGRYLPDGKIDTSFGYSRGVTFIEAGGEEAATAIAIDGNGRIVVAGYSMDAQIGSYRTLVWRFLENGAPDTSFGNAGRTEYWGPSEASLRGGEFDPSPRAIAIDSQGLIAIGGNYAAGRVLLGFVFLVKDNGQFGDGDSRFAGTTIEGSVDALAIDKQDRIVVGGRARGGTVEGIGAYLLRLQVRASAATDLMLALDFEFGDGSISGGLVTEDLRAVSIAIDKEGRIVAAFDGLDAAGERRPVVRRFHSEDPTPRTTLFTSCAAMTDSLPAELCPRNESICGNGIHEQGEDCDDGNTQPGDWCSPLCEVVTDLDADAIPDPSDWCVNVAGERDFGDGAKLAVSRSEDGTIAAMSFSGEVKMPADWSFADFDPNTADLDLSPNGGVSPLVVNYLDRQRWSAGLNGVYAGTGTYGWQKAGRTWTFHGDPFGHNGVTRMTLTDRGNGRVKVAWTVENGSALGPITPAETPLRAIMIFGRFGGASQRGECGEARFTMSECKWNATATQVTCQK